MKIKNIISGFFILSMITWMACESSREGRKIRLSDQQTVTRTDEQLTTTIHLEPALRRAVAVMFFENKTGDESLEWLQKGLTEMIIRSLSQSPHLSVLSTDRIYEILERMGETAPPGQFDMDMAAIVAMEANAEALLTGNITRSGDSLKINVRVHEPEKGAILQEESVEGPGLENIFSMVDHLTQRIKDDLQISVSDNVPEQSIAELSTSSLEAWQNYTSGVDNYNKYLMAEALPFYKKAVELDPDFVSAYIGLIRLYMHTGNAAQAFPLYQKSLKLYDKASPQERYQLDTMTAQYRNDVTLLISTTENWLAQYPDDRYANFQLGDIYREWKNYEQAITHYKNVAIIDPKNKLAYNLLGYTYAGIGDLKRATSYLKKYKELAADEPNPHDSMGEIYFWFGEFEKAEKQFKKALKINPDFSHAYVYLGTVSFEKGNYKKALKYYEGYLEKASDRIQRSDAHLLIARTKERLGYLDQAIQHYRKSLKYNISNDGVLERLYDIYKENEAPNMADSLLDATYTEIRKMYDNDATQLNGIYGSALLAVSWGVKVPETIDLLTDVLNRRDSDLAFVMNQNNVTNLKFLLTLLYILSDEVEKIDGLWEQYPEVISDDLWKIVSIFRNRSYSNNWRPFTLLNTMYYKDAERGEFFYDPLIEAALKRNIKIDEMMYRLFLTDIYTKSGNQEKAHEQLDIIGMPMEKTWMVIGPFDSKNGFRKRFPPERKIRFDKTVMGKTGKINWVSANDEHNDGFINFKQIFTPHNWTVGYGFVAVESPEERPVQFRFGTDDGCKIWLNNKEIWRFNQGGPAVFDHHKVDVTLNKGLNKILVKVGNGFGDWGFFFRITDSEGNGINDIQFISLADKKE